MAAIQTRNISLVILFFKKPLVDSLEGYFFDKPIPDIKRNIMTVHAPAFSRGEPPSIQNIVKWPKIRNIIANPLKVFVVPRPI